MDTNVQTMNTEIDNIVGSFSNDIESLMNLTGQSMSLSQIKDSQANITMILRLKMVTHSLVVIGK